MKFLKEDTYTTHQSDDNLVNYVNDILNNVKTQGDNLIKELSIKFDGVDKENILIGKDEIKAAYDSVSKETIEHLNFAAAQIKNYATKQLECIKEMEIQSPINGVTLGHRLIPVETCGCYVPGGRYPLPSSALMSVLVAKIAGVKNVYACCPPSKQYGTINPVVIVAMDIAGADKIFCMGGAQAIGAYAYGTDTVGKVDLIVGPGNKFVNEAKRQVMGQVGIDSLAGPSEVLIIADETAEPKFVAIDLLAQCEHDPNASATLVTVDAELFDKVNVELEMLVKELPTGEIAYKSWMDNGKVILADNYDEAIDIANDAAPEHLEIQTKCDDEIAPKLHNYGSLFIGSYTPVTFGDYCSGTNHILPTSATAKYSNGVWVGTFIKTSFYQKITKEGCANLSSSCMHIADLEGLQAHRKSIKIRMDKI